MVYTTICTEIFNFLVRTACEPRLVSYCSKHTSQSFSDMPLLCTYTQLENYRSYMDVLHVHVHIKQLLYYRRHSFCGLRSDCRVTAPDTHGDLLWYNIVCVLHVQALYIHPNYTWQQNSCSLWLHTTHQRMALQQMMYCFTRTKSYVMTYKLLQSIVFTCTLYIHIAVSVQLQWTL